MKCTLFAAALLLAPMAYAQTPTARYELGWRVRQLERAWAVNDDVEQRKAALPHIEAAVQSFFSLKFQDAAQSLDRATSGVAPFSQACNWNLAWAILPERRLIDAKSPSLRVDASAFYEPCVGCGGVESPTNVLRLELGSNSQEGRTTWMSPLEVSIPLSGAPTGDVELRVSASDGDFANMERSLTISIVADRDERLAALEAAIEKLPDDAPRLERETAKSLSTLLRSLASGSTEECDYPGARLLAEAEQVVATAAKGERFYDGSKSGPFWLTVPTSTKKSTRVRVLVPPARPDGAPPPLVLALHGAGGSENMFFESYGDGEIVRQCAKRGWLLVAPRVGFGTAPLGALMDELGGRFAFDTKHVFVVAHSMGVAAATGALVVAPTRFCAFAALGGGQALKAAESLKGLNVFVGAGERDFGRGGATKLHESLVEAGSERSKLHVYPNTEHLLVVQEALPDVFALFEELAGVSGAARIEPKDPPPRVK